MYLAEYNFTVTFITTSKVNNLYDEAVKLLKINLYDFK